MPTKIEWANEVWNPVVGCTPASAGCDHCYARAMFNRNLVIHTHKFENPATYPNRLDIPFHWKNPRRVFVNSMSDLFHPDVPFSFIDDVFSVMTGNSRHTFMVLTKRPKRMIEFLKQHYLPGAKADNIWLGVSVEDQETADQRIPQLLLATVAAVRFVSVEPMLGPVNLKQCRYDGVIDIDALNGTASGPFTTYQYKDEIDAKPLDWVVCGGETGAGARILHPEWARSLRDQCIEAKVPFFFKQWGVWRWTDVKVEAKGGYKDLDKLTSLEGPNQEQDWFRRVGKKINGRKLDGREWNQFPEVKQCIKN